MIVLFIIALIGFAIACPGITFFLLWFFTRPLVIGAIVVFVIISVIAICAAENKEETKNTSLNKPPNKLYIEKEDWYIRSLCERPEKNKKDNREANMALFSWFKYGKDGYDKDGFDKDGYNRSGYDKDGYDREGFNQAGFDVNGYDKNGFNRDGYDKDGYSRTGYDTNGYNRQGYTRDGFDKEGYDQEGYNRAGYDRAGYNRQGFDRNGYDKEGYSPTGYDTNGYNRQGYNRDGFGRDGYNREGYNRLGYDVNGFDRLGFDKDGFGRDGYDAKGYNAEGYNRFGFDSDGYNESGFDKCGYDKGGYNAKGYNVEGYDRLGYDVNGFDRLGFDKEGYDRAGYNRKGFDRQGYDAEGYNSDGYDKSGYDRNGYDRTGYNRQGVDKKGCNKRSDEKALDCMGYICPMCDTPVDRADRACHKCGCPIGFIKNFQANKKRDTFESKPVQIESSIVGREENSNPSYHTREERKTNLPKHENVGEIERRHCAIQEPASVIADGTGKSESNFEKRTVCSEQNAENIIRESPESVTYIESAKASQQLQSLQIHSLGETALCSRCRSIVTTYWGKCPKCGSELQELVLPKSKIPYIFPEKSEDSEDNNLWRDLIEGEHYSSAHKKSEEWSYRLSDEYNRDDFGPDEFEAEVDMIENSVRSTDDDYY